MNASRPSVVVVAPTTRSAKHARLISRSTMTNSRASNSAQAASPIIIAAKAEASATPRARRRQASTASPAAINTVIPNGIASGLGWNMNRPGSRSAHLGSARLKVRARHARFAPSRPFSPRPRPSPRGGSRSDPRLAGPTRIHAARGALIVQGVPITPRSSVITRTMGDAGEPHRFHHAALRTRAIVHASRRLRSLWRSALPAQLVLFYQNGQVTCEIPVVEKFRTVAAGGWSAGRDARSAGVGPSSRPAGRASVPAFLRGHRGLQPRPRMDIIYRYDPYQPIVPRQLEDAAAAIERLIRGHERHITIVTQVHREMTGVHSTEPVVIPSDPLSLGLPMGSGAPPVQTPFALVLGCSDARVPIEQIFGQSYNDLFVIRVAGNVLGIECLGSIDYAVSVLGESMKLLVVLGHSSGGAVTAAVDSYLAPRDYASIAFTHALRSLV